MGKRVSTIAPIEQMRGNLSGKQILKYNDNNNSAFDAPEGKQYAVNYRKSYIGCLRASDGLAYFQVKTKNCVNVTAESKLRMAVSGGAFAIVASIFRQKAHIYNQLVTMLNWAKLVGDVENTTTVRQYISVPLINMLRYKNGSVTYSVTPPGAPTITATILNPWNGVMAAQTTGAEISDAIIQKFWMQLADEPIQYKVSGATKKLLGADDSTFGSIADDECNVNTLKLRSDSGYMFSDLYGMWLNVTKSELVDTPFTVGENDEVKLTAGAEYYLSTEKIEPEP